MLIQNSTADDPRVTTSTVPVKVEERTETSAGDLPDNRRRRLESGVRILMRSLSLFSLTGTVELLPFESMQSEA